MSISIGVAFLAGLASFLSPCVFSLVPAYIGYLSGRSIAADTNSEETFNNSVQTFSHGLAFVIGFSVIFVALGLTASILGEFLGEIFYGLRQVLPKVGGIVVVIFGLHMTGVVRIPFLDYDLRPQSNYDRQRGYLSSFLMGIFFSAGWSPCVGPVLGAILTFALNGGSPQDGVSLLSAYSAGLGIPFLVAALGIGWVIHLLKKYSKTLHIIEMLMGMTLIIVGIMLFLGIFQQFSYLGNFINFGL